MLSHNTGHNLDPRGMRDALAANDALTDGGEVWWMSLTKALKGVHFRGRNSTQNEPDPCHQVMVTDEAIRRVNRLIELGCPIPVNVDNIGHDGRPDHWVLMVSRFGEADNMLDPAGDLTTFEGKYGDPKDALYGYAAIVGPQLYYPEDSDKPAGTALWKLIEYGKYGTVNYLPEAIDHLLSPKV
jgi:hypothetical protein